MLPSCSYHSSISCMAINVPLECPRLCGLCDRYEILKQVYGEENLVANQLTYINNKTRFDHDNDLHKTEVEKIFEKI